MFKNAFVYRIEHWASPALAEIDTRLATAPFAECGATQAESSGWVPPRGEKHAALAESVAGQLLCKLCTETKAVPGSVVKTRVDAQLDEIERETGRRPRGKHVKELKEAAVHALLPRAFPRRTETMVWLDAGARLAWVGAGSVKHADAVVTKLVERLGGALKLGPLHTALSPASAMADWLVAQQSPPGFSIDRDCELKLPEGERSAVRYARHALEGAEVAEHIRQGKRPTRLALTWAGRVSFVLTEALTLKRIQLVDDVLEGAGVDAANSGHDAGGFDADVAIATGELRQMLPALVAALGGLQADEPSAAAPLPAAAAAPSVAPWDTVPA